MCPKAKRSLSPPPPAFVPLAPTGKGCPKERRGLGRQAAQRTKPVWAALQGPHDTRDQKRGRGITPDPAPTGRGSQFGLNAEPAALLATAEVLLHIRPVPHGSFPVMMTGFTPRSPVGDHEETHELRFQLGAG